MGLGDRGLAWYGVALIVAHLRRLYRGVLSLRYEGVRPFVRQGRRVMR